MLTSATGIALNKGHEMESNVLLASSHLPELHKVEMGDEGLTVGSAVTVQQLKEELEKQIKQLPGDQDASKCNMRNQ